ncbi:OmpA family protein [Flavobacterium gawalongense]|uniref:OmpA family protein n=1 Tax=Flavobacterium gawalongense TaxID=2594432 RepID=A0A553BF57_9FLAO|nr:OmpA family protein [Flavobacterium gawalongense]TRW99742.1 OmpA family protein [Flavobacterium gawalongense]TRX03871.1 OmpA family protein [Flavobacterium gawalongense]TRX06898.1 OmpA family protein [Flavobacterium gawalongense]TRX07607.1 OmpA family protein [Flavobacterium gawalongense]TRX23483.1 OmpA family protein [Flavobacterium gawalongense]
MKKYTILLFFVLVSISLSAQNKDTKNADKLFDSYEYVQAVKEYLSLVEKGKADTYVYKQLGDSYYNMYNTIESEKWYAQAVKSKQDGETYYRYAQMLKSNGKYAESNAQMKVFSAMLPNDERAKGFNENPDYLSKLVQKEKLFGLKKINVNSEKSDFGAILYDNVLYFASARNENGKIYGWNNEPFLDLYQSDYREEDGTYSESTPISELNTVFHEGPLTMTKDGNTIYFSSESFNSKLFEKDKAKKLKYGQVSLYKAVKENGKWTAITPLPFNSKNYSTGNPSIDKDGKFLYFASNMPGSIGGTDLWKVAVNSDGTFGTPENLGSKINTSGDENFPYVTDDAVLYFSSNGLTGFGGLDVFSIDLNKNDLPNNIGNPVNAEKDDFAFTFNKEKNIGYLSSNRSGVDHIYSAVPVCKGQIQTIVKNAKNGNILADSRVIILDVKNNILDTKMSNEKGEVSYEVDCQKPYVLEVHKDGFVTKLFPVSKIEKGVVSIDAAIDPIEVIVTEKEIILNPIYFEYNKSDITKQGAVELDKLVYVMSQNDKLVIYVKSHTDSRGSDEYNLNLSDRRTKSTIQYIISKGINTDKISGKGFGESEPKVACGDICTDDEHALNRRSEFMIIK